MRKRKTLISGILVMVVLFTQLAFPQGELKANSSNLALGKSVTVSEEDLQWGGTKEKAVDGDVYSKWTAASGVNPNHWLMVDLGDAADLTGADITWGDNEIVRYLLQVSADGTTWTTVADQSNNQTKQLQESLSFTANSVRYVRVDISYYAGSGWWPAIAELQVWGALAEKNPADITAFKAVESETTVGEMPILPSQVEAVYADSTTRRLDVVWDSIPPSHYAASGSFTVLGTVIGASIRPSATVTVRAYRDDFIRGVDISTLTAIEDQNGRYLDSNGVERDLLDILKDRGVNYVRLRLWNDPQNSNGYNDKQDVLRMAKRVKAKGLKLLVDFHYSDDWAHPGQQVRPEAWNNLTFDELVTAVHDYTYEVISELKAQGATPDMVQIGNEINSGVLTGNGGTVNFAEQIALLNSGSAAARQAAGNEPLKVMIHLAEGGKNGTFRYFFDGIHNQVDYDVIGLSYYPFWHGTLDAVKSNMDDLATRYGKEVVIAETSYPFSYKDGDAHENIINSPEKLNTGGAVWPATVQGQYDAIRTIMDLISTVPDQKGLGFFYWEPAWIPANVGWIASEGDAWENQSMFDYDEYPANGGYAYTGYALDSLNVYKHGLSIMPIQRHQLAKIIADAKALVPSDYEASSWVSLASAIAAAEQAHDRVYVDTTVTQADIDAAAEALRAVMNALDVIQPDKSGLLPLIKQAEGYQEADWSQKTWQALQAALTEARLVYANTRATQTEVNSTTVKLQAAIAGLSNVDKTALNNDIANSKRLDGSMYTAFSWKALQRAIAHAMEVSSNDTVTQADVEAARSALSAAVLSLIELEDIAYAKPATSSSNAGSGGGQANSPSGANDQDPATSWGTDQGPQQWWKVDLGQSALLKKIVIVPWSGIKYTIEVSEDDQHYVTVVDTRVGAVPTNNHALDANTFGRYIRLTIVEGGTWVGMNDFKVYGVFPADTSALQQALAQTAGLVPETYTADSWSTLQAAIEAGVELSSSPEATQLEVDQAISRLYAAMNGLIIKVNVTGITLDRNQDFLKVGDTVVLTATVEPEAATNKAVLFRSSDVRIASVTDVVYNPIVGTSSVVVQAHGAGMAMITATAVDGGYTAQYIINVSSGSSTVPPGSSGSSSIAVPAPDPNIPTITRDDTGIQITGGSPDTDGQLLARITRDHIAEAAAHSKDGTIKIHMNAPHGAAAALQFSKEAVQELIKQQIHFLILKLGEVEIKLAVSSIPTDVAGELQLTARALLVDQYKILLTLDGKELMWKTGQVQVTLPYQLKAGQSAHQVIVKQIMLDGKQAILRSAEYAASLAGVHFAPTSSGTYGIEYQNVKFEDLHSVMWAQKSIERLAALGVIRGVNDQSFKPDELVTREQFLQMVVQALDVQQSGEEAPFTDVLNPNAWYYSAVSTGKQLGLITGKADGAFGLNEQIQRQDMAVIIYRALKQAGYEPSDVSLEAVPFRDEDEISNYAKTSVQQLKQLGVISGLGDGQFGAQATASRAQAAVIIDNLLSVLKSQYLK